ncbi:MAG: hypothetical protein WBO48_21955, partial [Candidatus Promineifilaceae bacterium]
MHIRLSCKILSIEASGETAVTMNPSPENSPHKSFLIAAIILSFLGVLFSLTQLPLGAQIGLTPTLEVRSY